MANQSLRFRPEVVDWWLALRALAEHPGRVHRWSAAEHPPAPDQTLEQHGTVTLIACLRGVCRIEDGRARIDLRAGDVVLVRSDPRDVPRIVNLSRASYRKMVQNLWWAAGYNIVAIPLAAGVLAPWDIVLTPAVGAVLMSFSTIIVALNAQLLRRVRL